tara:strand:+ start:136 stop:492 length:357 start_codon:yes stop_codon:yes gene_type:complete
MTEMLMKFLPAELVWQIEKTTHQMRWEDVMFQNQQQYWQKQHKKTRDELFSSWYWEDCMMEGAEDFWLSAGKTYEEINEFDWGLNSYTERMMIGRWGKVAVKVERSEYILQEPHPELQ